MARRYLDSRTLTERHPYIVAQEQFTRGNITVAQAVAMMLCDPEFIAECDMRGLRAAERAEGIVRGPWASILIQRMKEERSAHV